MQIICILVLTSSPIRLLQRYAGTFQFPQRYTAGRALVASSASPARAQQTSSKIRHRLRKCFPTPMIRQRSGSLSRVPQVHEHQDFLVLRQS